VPFDPAKRVDFKAEFPSDSFMKILILGAGGMIGHKMYEVLSKQYPDTYSCFRKPFEQYKAFNLFDPNKVLEKIDVQPFEQLENALNELRPNVILNCVGITLRKEEIKDLNYCLEVNSFLPQRLKCWSAQNKAHLIHFSTDCVFDGAQGQYVEESFPSAKDIYGRTKYLGEVHGPESLTLRGSMIGRELFGKTELLEWALSQKGKSIKGYSKALYSGVTTDVMAQLVVDILKKRPFLSGLYQVSSRPISKFDLLQKINRAFGLNMQIAEDCSYVSKKDLVSSKIQREMGFVCPSWDEMINQLASDKL
jgi:dTDP-4-dehydrorhamnose reductase